MGIDDHAIDALRVWYDLAIEEMYSEYKSGEYKKMSDLPSYETAVVYAKAMNIMVNALYLPEYKEQYRFRVKDSFVYEVWEKDRADVTF